jgi:hypothetical protein
MKEQLIIRNKLRLNCRENSFFVSSYYSQTHALALVIKGIFPV